MPGQRTRRETPRPRRRARGRGPVVEPPTRVSGPDGDDDPPRRSGDEPDGTAGVREPRRPRPDGPAGAAELPLPVEPTELDLAAR